MAEKGMKEITANLYDAGSEFVVVTRLPTVSKEKIVLNATMFGLEICVEGEKNVFEFCRFITFPEVVEPEKIVATKSEEGVLEVRVPKKTPLKAVKMYRVYVT
ncbi:MAG: Hsp20 family protein [Candidatus Hydrothermarchaeota archaeon]